MWAGRSKAISVLEIADFIKIAENQRGKYRHMELEISKILLDTCLDGKEEDYTMVDQMKDDLKYMQHV